MFAFEDFDTVPADNGEAALVSAETTNEVGSLAEEAGVIDASFVSIEDHVAAATELEGQTDLLAEGLESGEGVSEDTAQGVELAVESAFRRLRMQLPSATTILAAENFGSRNNRLASTKLAFEGLGDSLKKVWQKIIAMVKAVWARIRDFFTRSSNSVEGLEKDAVKVRAALSQFAGKTSGDVTSGAVLAAFSIDGKADVGTVDRIFQGTEAIMDEATAALSNADNIADGLITVAADPSTAKFNIISGAYAEMPLSKAKGVKKSKQKKGKVQVDVLDSPVFYRGQVMRVTITLPKDVTSLDAAKPGHKGLSIYQGTDAFELAGHLAIDVVTSSKEPAKKIKALDHGQMSKVMDNVDSLLEKLRKLNKDIGKVKELEKALTNVGEAVLKFAETKLNVKADDQNVARERIVLNQVRAAVTALNTATARISTGSISWGMGCAKAGMALVEASMKTEKKD